MTTIQPLQPFRSRAQCPPGACVCERERIEDDPQADRRPLLLTKQEEQRLLDRIERISTYEDLKHVQSLINAHLGAVLRIAPSIHEVRTARGILIVLEERPGLCRKVRQSVPAAVRRCLDRNPHIIYEILNAHDLLGAA